MANLFFTPPVPAGDGVGAGVATADAGAEKTIIVTGPFRGTLILEASLDGGTTWGQIVTFTVPGKEKRVFAANQLRVRRLGVPSISPGSPVVEVSSNDNGGKFATIPPAPGSVDISSFGRIKSLSATLGATINDTVIIEASDNGTDWIGCASFSHPGITAIKERAFFARFLRVNGNVIANVGAINDDISESSEDDLVIADSGDTTAETLTQKLQTTGGASKSVIDKGSGNLAVQLDSASQKQSLFLQAQVSTSGSVFIDAMNGNSIQIPRDGNYVARFEAEGESSATSGVLETSISLNGAPQPDSQRKVVGIGPLSHAGSIDLGALVAGDEISILLRKETGAGAVSLRGRNLVVTRVV